MARNSALVSTVLPLTVPYRKTKVGVLVRCSQCNFVHNITVVVFLVIEEYQSTVYWNTRKALIFLMHSRSITLNGEILRSYCNRPSINWIDTWRVKKRRDWTHYILYDVHSPWFDQSRSNSKLKLFLIDIFRRALPQILIGRILA